MHHGGVCGSERIDPGFLDLSTAEGEWSTSGPVRITPPPPDTHRVRGWVGSRASLDDMENGLFFIPPSQPLASRYTYCDTSSPAPVV
jgi:hypothetical protein